MKNSSLREAYRQGVWNCELCPVIRKLVRLDCDGQRGLQCHHCIASGTGGRWDVVSNLLMVCEPAHRWCHTHPREGRIAAIAVKLRKAEYNAEELRRATGQHLDGWLENQIESGGLLDGFAELSQSCLDQMRSRPTEDV